MVSRISFQKRLLAALNYNENKCSKGYAECIAAINYLSEASDMNFHLKLSMLEWRNGLNDRATTKTIHISLNFNPSEKLSDDQLKRIASNYMERIGFGDQPFLVYQHKDAGHPHLHIVSTTIKEDGSRIPTHNIGRTISEKARREIEEKFGLVKAGKEKKLKQTMKPIHAEKIIYGKTELKRSIANVVNEVFHQYTFSSLPEFNAALKQFNLVADRGNEDGRIYKHRGLVFRVLDEKGNKVGMPVKASLIACKPTLDNLEKKFVNKEWKEPFKGRVKDVIEDEMRSSNDLYKLMAQLKKKNIATVLRQNDEGRIYGITFIDHEKKVVFNGSDLGKEYSAANLMKRFETTTFTKNTKKHEGHQEEKSRVLPETFVPFVAQKEESQEAQSIIEELTSAQANNQPTPFQLKRKRKKRKQKLNN